MDTAPPENPGPAGAAPSAGGGTAEEPTPASPPPSSRTGTEQRLHRRSEGRMLAGVAAGLADYFDIDPTLVRIAFVVLTFMGGLAVPAYAAGWLLIPDEESDLSVAEELLAREHAHGAF